ncbi:hypothetical protein AXG93_1054s1630 [Marchantia polymorpha subsp. ruderalis]|uniref:Plant heme peroxidase family profile domain-containing protein n=1 Tax=Marchantia polymorpha subsp. ruderalis TaxID=1480154 RepID=A0A176WQ01_MARPO|nr:hypothetical protein AXG93_1054s1630 [Marchantia polymorpha subsp. ruderalis]
MTSPIYLSIGLAILYAATADAQLSQSFYAKSCPGGVQAVANVVSAAVRSAHTIGLTHCSKVTPRIYNFPRSASGADPYLNTTYVTEKRGVCPNSASSANKFVALDSSKGGQTFDINYFTNVLDHKAIFKSDDALISTSSGLKQVLDLVRSPSSKFFSQFGLAMQKMGRIQVLTGSQGEIRKVCSKKN